MAVEGGWTGVGIGSIGVYVGESLTTAPSLDNNDGWQKLVNCTAVSTSTEVGFRAPTSWGQQSGIDAVRIVDEQ